MDGKIIGVKKEEQVTVVLTPEQHEAIEKAGNPYAIPVFDPVNNSHFVLVPQEVYRGLVAYDDSEFDISEAYPLMVEVASKAGWCDPEMDIYDKFYPREKGESNSNAGQD